MKTLSTCLQLLVSFIICLLASIAPSHAATPNLADNFAGLSKFAKILIMPPDIELYSISAGGVVEPKADWTDAANRYVRTALRQRSEARGLKIRELGEADSDEFAEISTLHAAVARAISLHHFGSGNFALPTKAGRLDWSLGEAVAPLKAKADTDYALFVWMRDSYASSERQATMVVMALLGVGLPGGSQIGYASLVDLRSGQVVWFNQLRRASGDLREEQKARETVDILLNNFPNAK